MEIPPPPEAPKAEVPKPEVTEFMKRTAPAEGPTPWADVVIDTRTPSIARAYDAYLGGKDNFEVDRAVVARLDEELPEGRYLPRDNRAWVGRATRWLVGEAGIRQIIDLGSGLPTSSNVHDFAQAVAPETRVVYVDNDPMVLSHGRAILGCDDYTTVITGDVRDPESIFGDPDLLALIDLEQPFAILMASVLHHMPDGEDQRVAAEMRARLHPGCYLALINFHDPGDPRARQVEDILVGMIGSGWFRPYPQHRLYFEGLDLVEPGLCPANEWNPDADTPTDSPMHHLKLAGIGRCVGDR